MISNLIGLQFGGLFFLYIITKLFGSVDTYVYLCIIQSHIKIYIMQFNDAVKAIYACETISEAVELQKKFRELALAAPIDSYSRQIWWECEEKMRQRVKELRDEFWRDRYEDQQQNEALGK